jgi:glycosyltransferase involved in cell wall biosynthesis
MKILHINKFFTPHGGAEFYLHRLMERQAAAGHEVHILSTRSPRNLPSPDTKYFIHQYDFSRAEGATTDIKKAFAFLWNTEARDATKRVINDIRPDVIHLHNIYHHFSTSILGAIRQSGIPCVQTLHDLKLACPNYKMFTEGSVCERCKGGKYWNPILHRCIFSSTAGNTLGAVEMSFAKMTQAYEKTVHTFICPSQFYVDKFREWGEPADKFRALPNPADVSTAPAPLGGGFILFVGRLSQEKGAETLIRASARVPSLPLRIAGTGPEEEKLRHLARTLNTVHISFLGFVPPTELAKLRATAEAVIVPSIWYENGPLAVLEALGEGVPVIASNIGGIPELITDGQEGLLAAPGDVQAWVEVLERFQKIPQNIRQQMGAKGRERIQEKHNWDAHLKGLEKIYRS